MPETAHEAGFLASEWARFTRGWEALGPGAQSEAEARAFGREGTAGTPNAINVPGWNDVIHAVPKYKPTKAEADEFFGARRQGRDPQISREAFDAITAREAMRDRMASSAQPQYSQAFGQMMTAIDNVQDLLSTIATLGRITVNPALAALGHFAPNLAAKVGARLVPGIGWILGAADLLNLLSWLGLGGLIGYGALCQGARAAYAPALVQAGLRGIAGVRPCGMKAKVGQVADLNPFASSGALKNARKAARAMPGFGALLEAAQTTDQLWGVGVSLGAIAGAVMEAAYSATGAGRTAGARVNPPASRPETRYAGPAGGTLTYAEGTSLLAAYAPATLARIEARERLSLVIHHRCARALMDAPALLAMGAELSEYDYGCTLLVLAVALDTITRDLQGADVDSLLEAAAALEVGAPVRVDETTAYLLGATRDGGASVGRWALPGAPRTVRGRELVAGFAPALTAALRSRLEPLRAEVVGMFLGGLVNLTTAQAFTLATGEADPFRWRYEPDFVVLTALADGSRYLNTADDPDVLWRFWLAARELVRSGDRRSLLPSELDTLAATFGLRFIIAEQAYLRGELDSQV